MHQHTVILNTRTLHSCIKLYTAAHGMPQCNGITQAGLTKTSVRPKSMVACSFCKCSSESCSSCRCSCNSFEPTSAMIICGTSERRVSSSSPGKASFTAASTSSCLAACSRRADRQASLPLARAFSAPDSDVYLQLRRLRSAFALGQLQERRIQTTSLERWQGLGGHQLCRYKLQSSSL